MARPNYHHSMVMSWEGLKRLHQINVHLSAAANDIEELLLEAGLINDFFKPRTGVSIWRLRDCCDEMVKVESELTIIANDFGGYLHGKLDRPEYVYVEDYQI